ncbi:MAG: hypothetical protein K0M69_15915 [Youngiibacter sp.]|nr:hypothetical protein [Youngiibacter sp.]
MSYYMTRAELEEARYLREEKFLTYKEIGWRFGCKASEVSNALKIAKAKGALKITKMIEKMEKQASKEVRP